MMQLTARNVRAYKGAAASILLLFLIERRPLEQAELRRGTGYGDDVIHDALFMLREDGLIVQTGRYSWALLENAKQLPIGAVDALEPGPIQSELGDSSSSSSLNINQNELTTTTSQSARSEKNGAEVMQALEAAGIRNPARARLARLGHVTPDLIAFHARTADSLGQAIYRIEHNWPVEDAQAEEEAPAVTRMAEPAPDVQHPAWSAVLGQLARECDRALFNTWVAPTHLARVEDGVFEVACASEFGRDLLESRLQAVIDRALSGLVAGARVKFVTQGLGGWDDTFSGRFCGAGRPGRFDRSDGTVRGGELPGALAAGDGVREPGAGGGQPDGRHGGDARGAVEAERGASGDGV